MVNSIQKYLAHIHSNVNYEQMLTKTTLNIFHIKQELRAYQVTFLKTHKHRAVLGPKHRGDNDAWR